MTIEDYDTAGAHAHAHAHIQDCLQHRILSRFPVSVFIDDLLIRSVLKEEFYIYILV